MPQFKISISIALINNENIVRTAVFVSLHFQSNADKFHLNNARKTKRPTNKQVMTVFGSITLTFLLLAAHLIENHL